MRYLTLALAILMAISMSCTRGFKLRKHEMKDTSPWPYYRGQLASTGAADIKSFDGKLSIVWQLASNDRPVGPITIYHNKLIYPGSKKKIRFFDVSSGANRGRIKSKGIPQTGVVMQDSLAFYSLGFKKDRLSGVNLLNRKTIWSRQVKDACAGSILVDNSLIVSSADGSVAAYAPEDGKLQWKYRTEGRFVASAAYAGGKVFQPGDHGVLFALSPEDGEELFRVVLKGPVVSPVAVEKLVYATDVEGNVYGIEPDDGSIVWQTTLSGPIWTSPTIRNGRLFVGHSGGEIVALSAETGNELWRHEVGEVVKAAPLAVGDYVVVGTGTGVLLSLEADDGDVVDRIELEGSIEYPPITDGEHVFVTTNKGRITCFGENYEHIDKDSSQ